MRILIVSDTHRKSENLEKVLAKTGKLDMLIHLGDVESQEDYICALLDCPVHIVAGNNDFFTELPREEEIMIGRYRTLLTHGHYYHVSMGTERLKAEGISRDMDIAMFGHTHRPVIERYNEITVLNPGSLSYPRQEGHRPSYILMETDRHGEAHYTINYL